MTQAFLVIESQQELIEGNECEPSVYKKEEWLVNINLVVEQATLLGHLIVFIRDLDVAEGKGTGFEIHQKINIPSTAKIFDKKATNAFYGTPLLDYLKENQIYHLVVMGCKTELCIDTAVRTATVNGFDVTLVEDGHSTTNHIILQAEQIIGHHNKILHGHYNVDHFSMVRKAKENLFEPLHNSYR